MLTLLTGLTSLVEHANQFSDYGLVELEVVPWAGVPKMVDKRGLLAKLPCLDVTWADHRQHGNASRNAYGALYRI